MIVVVLFFAWNLVLTSIQVNPKIKQIRLQTIMTPTIELLIHILS